ncbi:hypothetical protein BHM03_00044491 [Ensete ventricosum]|nr:hypothetical protein BHM03_00044491 [Ensete ventricosum]
MKAAIGLTAGAIGACVGSPADLALIRMQADATLPAAQRRPTVMPRESKYPTLKSGGLLKFYTGFPVYCVRIAPHIMMTWIFLNQIQKVEKSLGL